MTFSPGMLDPTVGRIHTLAQSQCGALIEKTPTKDLLAIRVSGILCQLRS